MQMLVDTCQHLLDAFLEGQRVRDQDAYTEDNFQVELMPAAQSLPANIACSRVQDSNSQRRRAPPQIFGENVQSMAFSTAESRPMDAISMISS